MILEIDITASLIALVQVANNLHVSGSTEVGSTNRKTKIK